MVRVTVAVCWRVVPADEVAVAMTVMLYVCACADGCGGVDAVAATKAQSEKCADEDWTTAVY